METCNQSTCRYCGADRGLHQAKTMQCPAGGYEAPVGKPQRWSDLTFEPELNVNKDLLEACEQLLFDLAESHTAETDADHYGDNPDDCLYCKHIKQAEAAIAKAEGK